MVYDSAYGYQARSLIFKQPLRLLHGLVFGEPTCEEYEFKENTFNISGNNFEILNEISTTEINIDAPIKFDEITISEGSFYFEVK